MAAFTERFSIVATLADGRQLEMSSSTSYSATKVFRGTLEPNGAALMGPLNINQPQLDGDPVFLICQYMGGGVGDVTLKNTGGDTVNFNMRDGQSFALHGTSLVDTDTSAVTATVTQELDELATDNCPPGGMVHITALI